jgi:hypothetical protein
MVRDYEASLTVMLAKCDRDTITGTTSTVTLYVIGKSTWTQFSSQASY